MKLTRRPSGESESLPAVLPSAYALIPQQKRVMHIINIELTWLAIRPCAMYVRPGGRVGEGMGQGRVSSLDSSSVVVSSVEEGEGGEGMGRERKARAVTCPLHPQFRVSSSTKEKKRGTHRGTCKSPVTLTNSTTSSLLPFSSISSPIANGNPVSTCAAPPSLPSQGHTPAPAGEEEGEAKSEAERKRVRTERSSMPCGPYEPQYRPSILEFGVGVRGGASPVVVAVAVEGEEEGGEGGKEVSSGNKSMYFLVWSSQ